MDTANIEKVLRNLNQWSGHGTLFYLDNETPKGRMSHVWWFGYKYDYPAWQNYSQDRPIKLFEGDLWVEINPLTGEPHTRRNLFEIMAFSGPQAPSASLRIRLGGGSATANSPQILRRWPVCS